MHIFSPGWSDTHAELQDFMSDIIAFLAVASQGSYRVLVIYANIENLLEKNQRRTRIAAETVVSLYYACFFLVSSRCLWPLQART